MIKLASTATALLVVLAAAVSGVSYLRILHADVVVARQQRDDARRSLADRDGTIGQLQKDADDKARQQAQLDRTHTAIANRLNSIQMKNRRLTNENAALRAWADAPLPDDVVRLQSSPTLTGATDYVDYVPTGEPLHAAGDGAADER